MKGRTAVARAPTSGEWKYGVLQRTRLEFLVDKIFYCGQSCNPSVFEGCEHSELALKSGIRCQSHRAVELLHCIGTLGVASTVPRLLFKKQRRGI